MIRDPARLAAGSFDVLVIGGGIHGLFIAYDAALRGLRTALVERHDFGSGASFNHHKTLHGGLRYLQSFDLARMRTSIRERRTMARIAPSLVSPLAFLMPTGRSLTRNAWAMRAAFLADSLVAWDRNAGVPETHRLPAGRVVGPAVLDPVLPGVRVTPAGSIARWYDYRIDEGDRLNLAVALAAARHGAVLANYVSAIEPIRSGRTVTGMTVRDEVTGEAFAVRAAVTVNAAGAGGGRLMAAFGVRRPFPLVKAMNLVTRRAWGDTAVALPTPEGRVLVALPWHGRLLVGTAHGAELTGADDTLVHVREVGRFLAEVNATFPGLRLEPDEIALVHRGVVPARQRPDRQPVLLDAHEVRNHARDGVEGAVSVVGVKYTTARHVAERAVNLVCRKVNRAVRTCATDITPLLEGRTDRTAATDDACIADVAGLAALYGSAGAEAIAALCALDHQLAQPIAGSSVVAARIVHAIRDEAALTLEDVVVRRTRLGAAGHPGAEIARACAAIMAAELGWSAARIEDEIASLDRFYSWIRPAAPTDDESADSDRGITSGRAIRVEDPRHADRKAE
jgi:glycerol-3-phosphate dehydrogenase